MLKTQNSKLAVNHLKTSAHTFQKKKKYEEWESLVCQKGDMNSSQLSRGDELSSFTVLRLCGS